MLKEISPEYPGRTDPEAETLVLWPPDAKNWLTGKDPNAGKDWRQEEKGKTEDEMVGWHHWLNGHEFEHALGVGDGQGSLARCSPWGRKESDMTELLNSTELSCFFAHPAPLLIVQPTSYWLALVLVHWKCFSKGNQRHLLNSSF